MMLFVEIMTMLDFVICRNGHIKEPVWSELGHVSGQRETAPIWTQPRPELEKYGEKNFTDLVDWWWWACNKEFGCLHVGVAD